MSKANCDFVAFALHCPSNGNNSLVATEVEKQPPTTRQFPEFDQSLQHNQELHACVKAACDWEKKRTKKENLADFDARSRLASANFKSSFCSWFRLIIS